MSTFTYQVVRGGQVFLQTVETASRKEAKATIMEGLPKTAVVTFVASQEGSLEDYLGPKTIERIEEAKDNLRKAQPPKKRSYAAIKKAAEK